MKTVAVTPVELRALDAMIGAWKRAERRPIDAVMRTVPLIGGLRPALQALCPTTSTCDTCLITRVRGPVKGCPGSPISEFIRNNTPVHARAAWELLIEVRRHCEVKLTVLQKLRALVLGRSA
jgi:hypothetical protein